MKLGIFGTGYAGLVTSVGLDQLGHTVTAIDKNPDIIARLSDGVPTIHEPGLQELLTSNLDAGRLSFTTKAEDAMGDRKSSRLNSSHRTISYAVFCLKKKKKKKKQTTT